MNSHVVGGCDCGPWMGLLRWLPGETLYSLIARQHMLWGHRLTGQTAKALFGHDRRGYQHDFPGHLAELVARTHGPLGDAPSLALDRTLLRYYRPFLSEAHEQAFVTAMGGASVAHVRRRLIAARPGPRSHHHLKACVQCIEDDRERTGWSYWHMDHQYPGAWICPRHALPLRSISSRANRYDRIAWQCPSADRLLPSPISGAGADEFKSCARFARLVGDVVDRRPVVRIGFEALNACYVAALDERGLVSVGGRVSIGAAASQLLSHVRPLRLLPGLEMLPCNVDRASAQLAKLLAPAGSVFHPLLHSPTDPENSGLEVPAAVRPRLRPAPSA